MGAERPSAGRGPTGAETAFGTGQRHQEIDLAPGTHPVIPEAPLRPDWSRPRPLHLPAPTYWPAVLGLGVMFIGWGVATSIIVSVVGLVLFAIGLAGWIGDMRHGTEHTE